MNYGYEWRLVERPIKVGARQLKEFQYRRVRFRRYSLDEVNTAMLDSMTAIDEAILNPKCRCCGQKIPRFNPWSTIPKAS